MKVFLITFPALLSIASVSAFAPATIYGSRSVATASGLSMSSEKRVSTRLEFIQQSVAGVAATLTFLPGAANAAKYGGFGAGSPEVLDPKTAIVDTEILSSAPVQKALDGVRSYLKSVKEMQSQLSADSQVDLGPKIRKDFEFAQLRADLNNLNSAFDEDTQRGTDRIIRIIMQDITELETSSKQKDGVTRSERRVGNMKAKLEKLEKAFEDYLAFV